MWRQKSMESRLLIALIVIRNLAFYCDRNFWNLKTCRHKKYGVKTFSCSYCDKKFGLFWQEFLKLEENEDTNSMVSKRIFFTWPSLSIKFRISFTRADTWISLKISLENEFKMSNRFHLKQPCYWIWNESLTLQGGLQIKSKG